MVRPIQRRLLPHSVGYREYITQGKHGEEWKDSISITRVRVEPTNKVVTSSEGDEIQSNTRIFIDRVNSNPAFALAEKSKIIFDNKEYVVASVATLYASSTQVHHWEVYCN
ncbi:putative minor capsid protein [Listeria booriae]|uniref:putative minor capsid protein n=1 Tax=Listeria booriae TaxID=1552123 RepID=UPI0016256200|nr:putative minor capsid protein [Listeria booriae]MBC2196815.1 minor capsid protein [Listeria booriae]